ncbi:MAG TPA: FliA/WhiG family RNA polymerase sigma factor [Bryobacteraceae bacterium]|nr:FliA/WhiG family RNA polymerase sigma factor [Bryobacteraceae bacterium]
MNQGPIRDHEQLRNQGVIEYPATERDRLILKHLNQVKLIARRIRERLPHSVNLDDLVSAGMLGLISAIDQYDSTYCVKLKTYAEYKIKGAILDCLREMDWAPRQHRKRAREIDGAVAALEQALQRTPSEEEVAQRLGLSVEEYQNCLSEVRGITLGSLEDSRAARLDDKNTVRDLADAVTKLPSQIAERAEMQAILYDALQRMPELERTVLSFYYYEEMTLREISSLTGLHLSRISQLKSRAISRLRSYMHTGHTPGLPS